MSPGTPRGDWSQSDFDSIVGSDPYNGSWKAPQIYTDYMRNLTNAIQKNYVLVTWSLDAAYYPYNSRSYAIASINGYPYYPRLRPDLLPLLVKRIRVSGMR